MPKWLKDAVFYEIYPQSFQDSNGDGIGDIPGMESRLDYIASLGCNALWINPVYDSPFRDAGYDVRDYYKIAPRYGTNEDMYHFFSAAHERGIKVLMDLVPGHTSDEHAWFQQSKLAEENEYSDRYVWTNGAFVGIADHPYISGMCEREGAYMLNFFASQPALNYGWGVVCEPWQCAADSSAAKATAKALKDIMRFWLDHGCDGFRVDMADSLVKNDDDDKHATARIWKDVRKMLDQDYPEAALVSEWCNPNSAINLGGFHMDFYLDHQGNGYNQLLRSAHPFFRTDDGDIQNFLKDYMPKYARSKDHGYISMFTCNHDTPRLPKYLNEQERRLFYAFLFTMPGVPFLYYGDEIGMRYLSLKSVEGGYHRTGSRTPMQWNHDKNHGFSTADTIYIQQDTAIDAPTVEDQSSMDNSLLHYTKKWIALRHQYEDLQADETLHILHGEKNILIYQRGNMICALNTSSQPYTFQTVPHVCIATSGDVKTDGKIVQMKETSFVLLKTISE